jgi:hypothetical protein
VFVTRDLDRGQHEQLLDQAAPGLVHQLVDGRTRVLHQFQQRQQHLAVFCKTGFQRVSVLLCHDTKRNASAVTALLGRLHFGGSPVRSFVVGKPDFLGFTRKPPPSTFNYAWDIAHGAQPRGVLAR